MTGRLKLRAEDPEDLAVIAACLHDAIVCVGELAYAPEQQCFAAILVRWTWEDAASSTARAFDPVKAGLYFDTVHAVERRGFDQGEVRKLLRLVTILCAPAKERQRIRLCFACGAEIRLDVDRLTCHVEDLEARRAVSG